jgi:PKD repeat protein
VTDTPAVNFTFNSAGVCQSGPVCFNDSTVYHFSPSISHTVSWLWEFGDGTTDTVASPCHFYRQTGVYNVRLFVRSNFGCFDSSIIKKVTISVQPVAGYIVLDSFPVAGTSLCFYDASVNDTLPGPPFWTWNFGDNTPVDTVYADSACHIYANSGFYMVTMCVYNALGCSDCASSIIVEAVRNSNGIDALNPAILKIYPNPVRQEINLYFNPRTGSSMQFELADQLGQTVMKESLSPNQTIAQFSTGKISSGLYYWKLINSGSVMGTGKLVILK